MSVFHELCTACNVVVRGKNLVSAVLTLSTTDTTFINKRTHAGVRFKYPLADTLI
jgi:hypothetical protein